MPSYKTNDGETLRGGTAAEIVDALRRTSRRPCPSVEDFMREVAGRSEIQTGKRVRCDSAEAFLADLVAAGLMIPLSHE